MKVGSKCLSTTMALSSTALLLLLWSGVGSAQIVSTAIAVKPHAVVMCEDLRLRCAFADGCGVALHNYFLKCDKMLQTEPTSCPDSCLYALVALTSTVEGKSMMEVSTSYVSHLYRNHTNIPIYWYKYQYVYIQIGRLYLCNLEWRGYYYPGVFENISFQNILKSTHFYLVLS